ncbi:hypothetical protein C0Z17_05135 [Trinickia caryophylli]|nr:hypothetical protein C0Z17_05135 [Trinickia caryophylli]
MVQQSTADAAGKRSSRRMPRLVASSRASVFARPRSPVPAAGRGNRAHAARHAASRSAFAQTPHTSGFARISLPSAFYSSLGHNRSPPG